MNIWKYFKNRRWYKILAVTTMSVLLVLAVSVPAISVMAKGKYVALDVKNVS